MGFGIRVVEILLLFSQSSPSTGFLTYVTTQILTVLHPSSIEGFYVRTLQLLK